MSKSNGKLTRQAFLAAATHLHESTADGSVFGLASIPIRELTARARLDILEAVKQRDGAGNVLEIDGIAQIDNALWQAMVIQAGVIDAPGGDLILTLDDVPELAEKGRDSLRLLAGDIAKLSYLSEADLKSSRTAPDDEQRGTAEGPLVTGDAGGGSAVG